MKTRFVHLFVKDYSQGDYSQPYVDYGLYTQSERIDRDYLGILDMMILTSISEGQPLVILEGWAAKIPFISTDVGSCRDMLTADEYEGDCGIITKLASPSDTATAILKLIDDPELRHEMGENGRKRVERLYNDDVLIESYRKIYESLYKSNK